MKRLRRAPHLIVLPALIAASDRPPLTLVWPEPASETPALARSADVSARANFSFDDRVNAGTVDAPTWTPAGVRGDGQLKTGVAARSGSIRSNEHQGNYCGVNARFDATAGSGDLDYAPGVIWTQKMQSACGAMRGYRFSVGGSNAAPVPISAHSNARGLYGLAAGQSVMQWEGFGVSLPNNCDRLVLDAVFPPASSPVQTRLAGSERADRLQVRQWTIASRGSHAAMCIDVDNRTGAWRATGETHYLPCFIRIVEIPYPYPSFP